MGKIIVLRILSNSHIESDLFWWMFFLMLCGQCFIWYSQGALPMQGISSQYCETKKNVFVSRISPKHWTLSDVTFAHLLFWLSQLDQLYYFQRLTSNVVSSWLPFPRQFSIFVIIINRGTVFCGRYMRYGRRWYFHRLIV